MATPPTDPVLADPMLRELRQRHPEVDIVVLPQPTPVVEATVPALDPEAAQALAATLEGHVDDLVAHLSREPGWTTEQRLGQWRTDGAGHTFYETSLEVGQLEAGDNVALLRATGAALLALGWRAVPVPGERPKLEARRRTGESAAAKVRETSLVLTCRTPLVRVSGSEVPR